MTARVSFSWRAADDAPEKSAPFFEVVPHFHSLAENRNTDYK
jgi:hypothetical protein